MKRRVEFILQHGWAFDNACWRAWMPHLRENQDCHITVQTPDRGYFGAARALKPFEETDSLKVVAAHSLGLHLLPQDTLAQADLIVLTSSFSHFHTGETLQKKRSQKTIKRMLTRLHEDPLPVLKDFYCNCYHPLLDSHKLLMRDTSLLNLDLLIADLELLDTNTFNLDTFSAKSKILLLHGSEDIIVPAEHSHELNKRLSGSSLILFEGVGHSLPFTHAAPLWIAVRNSLRHLLAVKA